MKLEPGMHLGHLTLVEPIAGTKLWWVRCGCGSRVKRNGQTIKSSVKQRARIIDRATGHCELCGKRGNLHVGHLLSVKVGLDGGLTETELNSDENLCAQCDECNLGQGKLPMSLRLAVMLLKARCRLGNT